MVFNLMKINKLIKYLYVCLSKEPKDSIKYMKLLGFLDKAFEVLREKSNKDV